MYSGFTPRYVSSTDLQGTSSFLDEFAKVLAMTLQIMRRTTSPTPTGRTPGHLSRAISRQATKAVRPLGSTRVVEMRLAREAKASQRSEEADLKEEHISSCAI